MTGDVEVINQNQVTTVEEYIDQTDILIENDETQIIVAGDETIIESVDSVSHVILVADVVNVGDGSGSGSANSFFPSGW